MCTVTFLPSDNGFILTSNRDERLSRPAALLPTHYTIAGNKVIFPKDALAGGTWIVAAPNLTLCLLNGGLEKHTPKPQGYRKSRGLVVIDVLNYITVEAFLQDYNLFDIEPFTLIFAAKNKLSDLRWTGFEKIITHHNHQQTFIWSSVTLYSPEIIAQRQQWFAEWLTKGDFSQQAIVDFHHFGGNGNKNYDLLMQRGNFLKTVSITSVSSNADTTSMRYEDTQAQKIVTVTL